MDRPPSVEGLVVAGWVDGQSPEELSSRSCLDPGGEGVRGRVPIEGAVETGLVVIETEGIELSLEIAQGACRRLAREKALEGRVKTLDFAARLGVVGGGVLGDGSGVRRRDLRRLAPGVAEER